MKSLSVSLIRFEAGVRWAARTLAVLVLALVLVPIVVNSIYDVVHGFYEGGLPHAFWFKGVEPIQMVFFWITCIGMVVAWRWPMSGGAISVAGMILFFTVALAGKSELAGGFLPYLLLLPGILFLADGLIRRRMAAE